jgi:hypothetical protein
MALTPSNFGCIDMTVPFNGHVFLFEFKGVELAPTGGALQQIGVEFNKASRNIVGFEVETVGSLPE